MNTRAGSEVLRGWKFSVRLLAIPPHAITVLEQYGYDTAERVRDDLAWYDSPELSVKELDAICKAAHIHPSKVASRFTKTA